MRGVLCVLLTTLLSGCFWYERIAARPQTVGNETSENEEEIPTFAVYGDVSGLQGGGLALTLNASETITVTSDVFTFSTRLAAGASYQVLVASQPSAPAQDCTLTQASGVVTADVFVHVDCGPPRVRTPGEPRAFFTDLTSGPNAGGEQDAGVFITIYGLGFGATRGAYSRVTIGGVAVERYVSWGAPASARGLQTIVVQLGKTAPTGAQSLVVDIDGGLSDPLPFDVRPGRIRFLSRSGVDGAAGDMDTPLKTLTHAAAVAAPGDVFYLREGTYDEVTDNANLTVTNTTADAASAPVAFLAYPGENVQIGQAAAPAATAVRVLSPGYSGEDANSFGAAHVVIAGIRLVGQTSLSFSGRGRIIANTFIDTETVGYQGALTVGYSTGVNDVAIHGNLFRNAGSTTASAVWLGGATAVRSVSLGWNELREGRRPAIYMRRPDGTSYDITLRDNLIFDNRGAAIAADLARAAPTGSSQLVVTNNIVVENDVAMDLLVDASVRAWVAHNTFFSNQSTALRGYELRVEASALAPAVLVNNIIAPTISNVFFVKNGDGGACDVTMMRDGITAANNLFATGTQPSGCGFPGGDTAPRFEGPPGFADAAQLDFSLRAGSQAIANGAAHDALALPPAVLSLLERDAYGFRRATPPSIGARIPQ